MKIHEYAVFLLLILSFVGDIGRFANKWSGSELISRNSAAMIPGADAILPFIAGKVAWEAGKRGFRKLKQKWRRRKNKGRR
uniref:Uncharacterized protein n=1 Tax=Magallana gigas TaxID=29159 RepID=A0A8W8I3P7_MAGGI